MVTLNRPKSPLSSLHIFSPNKFSSSPSSTSPSCSSLTTIIKMKNLVHNIILSHICRVIRALSKAKSIFLEIFRENQILYLKQTKKKNKYSKKILFGSFRLHYNWCSSSSHVMPIPSPVLEGTRTPTSHIYFDTTWNSIYSTEEGRNYDADDKHVCNGNGILSKEDEGELSGYLQWLEEKGTQHDHHLKGGNGKLDDKNEIDKLADMFIANCHEKFRLEKIESYRRYQELLARSI